MNKPIFSKEELTLLLSKFKTIYEVAKYKGCCAATVKGYMKKFGLSTPPGFFKNGKKVGRQKGCKWSENQRKIMQEKFKGENNPFFGKKHDEKAKEKMSQPRPSIEGDNNPFKKACVKNPELIEEASERKIYEWSKLNHEKRHSRFAYNNLIGDLSKGHWTAIKSGAKKRDIEVSVTLEYIWELFLKQEKKCALTGIDLNLKSCYEITASLDRIDSSIGYIEGNVQWVHKIVNMSKMTLNNEDFITLCRMVVNYNEPAITNK